MPTEIRDNGFFSDEARSLSAGIRTEHKQLFFYLTETNEQAHKYLAKLEVNQDLEKLVAAALLSRVLTAYQALVLLAERGFASEIRVITRSILEAKFKLGFLLKEPKAAKLMLARYEEDRVKRLKKYKSGDLPVHKDAADQNWDKLIEDAKARQKKFAESKSLPSIKQIATTAGFLKDYDGPCSFLSDAIHSGAGELDIYLEFNEERSAATDFRYGPNAGPWMVWCTLMATGFLRDCIEISAAILGLINDRSFRSWFKARCKRHNEMLDRYRDQLSADFEAGKR
jgi:hypothetical protein